jgi:hypothetical protein
MITFVDVFTILPDKQQDLLRAIQNVYQKVVKHQPGYISARLFKSDDGAKITAISKKGNPRTSYRYQGNSRRSGFV